MTTLREAARLVASVLEEKQQPERAAALRLGLGTVAWYMPDILNMEYGPLALGAHAHGPGEVTESVVIDGGIIYLETCRDTACVRRTLWSLLTGLPGTDDGREEAGSPDLTRSPPRSRPPCGGHERNLGLAAA